MTSTSCRVYPSEYAYLHDSVTTYETSGANCWRYQSHLKAPVGVQTSDYIHCSGSQLQLADSNYGLCHYDHDNYYEWPAGTVPRQLLFTFPTRVNLTSITLNYYSDSQRGLPPLRVYAVPDDFDIWDPPPGSGNTLHVTFISVSPGEELEGPRHVSETVNFSTTKLLMTKAGSTYQFALSEVEFLRECEDEGMSSIKQ